MHTPDSILPVLNELILQPGVSGNEEPVAAAVIRQLSAAGFADNDLKRDSLGNLWIHLGPDGEPERLLVAHLDEIGFRITSIRSDGICRLQPLGGIDAQLWEGTVVQVHTKNGPVPGCIAPLSHHVSIRSHAAEPQRLDAEDLMLDLGAASPDEVAELGVELLDTVTWPKRIDRLYGNLVQARSLDDRFGCCALSAVAQALIDSHPAIPTLIAWSVQEEVGLRGARMLADRFTSCTEVIAIDSFAVGTGPRDNKQYDAVKPGLGPALRSWDSTTLVQDSTRKLLLEKAKKLGFKLQYGFMPGGNDASMFEASGARVFGLTIPVQYSHSASERVHLGDLATLADLLVSWCQSPLDL
jgi:putative aminopeptidase FrvX